jgi:lipid-binding SYLF domain-containing protein
MVNEEDERMTKGERGGLVATAAATIVLATGVNATHAASAREISSSARAALSRLYASNPTAKTLGQKAKGILVFPSILKAGFIVGGQGGDGAMFKGGKTVGYYRTAAASYGLQAGAQKFGYALFFMTDSALSYLDKSGGWEVGSGPSLVLVDEGFGKSISSTTLTQDVYAYIFNQKGLMGGLGIQGSKITRIHPK